MKNKIQWELIIEYLEGRTTQEDEANLSEWIQSDIKNRHTFDLIKKIWGTPENKLPIADVENAWMKVKDRISFETSSKDLPFGEIIRFDPNEKENQPWYQVFGSKLLKIAAIILIMIITSYFLFTKQPSMNEIVVENTQRAEFNLTDGTQVTLDAGTIFSYPRDYESDKREVFLDGEGYFEVAHNNEKPFIIHANDAVIKVLGTKFNVRAWRQNKKVVVAVADGKVSLQPKNESNSGSEVVITKGQVSVMKEDERPSEPQDANINDHLSWLDRKIYFKNVPLQEVLDQLERWYDIDIILSDEFYASNQVTIYIDNKPLEEILDVIALMNDFRYKQDGKTIILSPNEEE